MSSNQTFSSSSSASFSYTSSSSINGQEQVSGQRHMQQSHRDPSGNTTVHTASQNLGEPIVQDTRSYDAEGRQLIGATGGADSSRRIEDVSDADQAKRDREYEERMEDEYAKREGGA